MGFTAAQIKETFYAEMGGVVPGGKDTLENSAAVHVELTDDQFLNVMKLAKQWFTARKGFVIWRPIVMIEATANYRMDEDVQQVLDVVFEIPSDVAAFFSLGFFDVIPYGPQNIGSIGAGLTNYSGFAQLLMFNETRKRVFSVDPEWFYDQQTRVLHIITRSGSASGLMMVKCKTDKFEPEQLNDKDALFYARWVRAKCKEIVGRVRSKYDSMPAAGGTVSLDGKDLIAEAKEEFIEIEKEVFASQGPDEFIVA